jgi:hypothetical protein
MALQIPRTRFTDILKNHSTGEGVSFLDLLYPPSELISLIPAKYRSVLDIAPEDYSSKCKNDDLIVFLEKYCLYRVCASLFINEDSLASGFFLVYLRYFNNDPVFTNAKGITGILEVLKQDNGKARIQVVAGKILPILEQMGIQNISSSQLTAIKTGSWINPSQSYAYAQLKTAVDQMMHVISGQFPALRGYLEGKIVPQRVSIQPYDIRGHFLTDDEIILMASEIISKVPHGDIENRFWSRFLHPKIFCHLTNKRLIKRALKTIFQKMDAHHVEIDLLTRQRRYLLARIRGIVSDPIDFLDRSFGSLCLEKLSGIPFTTPDISIEKEDLKDRHPNYAGIFDQLSRGVFFLDFESGSMIMDLRSAMFHSAYSVVGILDKDFKLPPKLPMSFFDVYSFIGRIAMDNGGESQLIHYSEKLVENSRKSHGIRGLLIAGSLILYADLNPQDHECSAVYGKVIDGLAGLWKRRVPPAVLDRAAEILNILDRKLLEKLLEWDLKRQPIGTNPWKSAIGRYAFLEHPLAMDVIREAVDALLAETPPPINFEPQVDTNIWIRCLMVHSAISEFISPYREILLEYLAFHYPPIMRQCIHDIVKSNSLPALRRLREIASAKTASSPEEIIHYSQRMLRNYATAARTSIILEELADILNSHLSPDHIVINSVFRVFENVRNNSPKSPLGMYRAAPIALGRNLIPLIGTNEFDELQMRELLILVRGRDFWPVLDLLLPLHKRYVGEDAPRDLAWFYREALLRTSNRNNAHILEKELHSADDPHYQALLLECMGNARALRLDSFFEHYYSSPSVDVAIAAIVGLTVSVGKEAGERLEIIAIKDHRKAVSEAAFEGLAKIQSPQALPYLKKRLKHNPNDSTAIGFLAGYALPETEKLMVDTIRKINPGDRWMYCTFLLRSGGGIAINGFIEFTGPNPGYFLEDNLDSVNPASLVMAIDEWLSASQKEAEGWQIPVLTILARSPDPRCIPVLLDFAYKSANPCVASAAVRLLKEEVDFLRCPSAIEIILSYSGLLRRENPYANPIPFSISGVEEANRKRRRDEDILSAYLRSFKQKNFSIPAQWREYIPRYLLDESL